MRNLLAILKNKLKFNRKDSVKKQLSLLKGIINIDLSIVLFYSFLA
jgi:hypothetical protein